VLTGVLYAYAETGSEGFHWSVHEDGKEGYEGLHILRDGDELTVFNDDESVLWQGVIDFEYRTGWRHYPLNPRLGQQCALGLWVHGNQEGWEIDKWAKLFIDEKRATLLKTTVKSSKKRYCEDPPEYSLTKQEILRLLKIDARQDYVQHHHPEYTMEDAAKHYAFKQMTLKQYIDLHEWGGSSSNFNRELERCLGMEQDSEELSKITLEEVIKMLEDYF